MVGVAPAGLLVQHKICEVSAALHLLKTQPRVWLWAAAAALVLTTTVQDLHQAEVLVAVW
jgi:hypothetical protein